MKHAEIKVGSRYVAKVNEKLTTVRVDAIREVENAYRTAAYRYDVTNLETGRKTTFASAQKFRSEVFGPEAGAESAVKPEYPIRKAAEAPSVAQEATQEDRVEVLPTDAEDIGLNTAAIESQRVESETAKPEPKRSILGDSVRALSLPVNSANLDTAPHVVVVARAGTGKTTTLVSALQVLMGQQPTTVVHRDGRTETVPIVPSAQQKAVWDDVGRSRGKAKSVCFVAFNKSIAGELQRRVPQGVEAMTLHSMGLKSVTAAFGRGIRIEEYRVGNLVCSITGTGLGDLRKTKPLLLPLVERLVGLVKMNLTDTDAESLTNLIRHYDIDTDGAPLSEAFDLVPRVIEKCLTPDNDCQMDFNDMIWLPVALKLPVRKYDLLMVDEAQDLNRCQQSLAKMAGSRLVLCGDPAQAIYGFAGADSESIDRMCKELDETDRGVLTLYLNETRRCGRKIVAEAQRFVPDFRAHESNVEGSVVRATFKPGSERDYRKLVKDGDMILSRTNAPLIAECFRFLRAGRKATIQGRDVGKGLINLVTRMKVGTMPELVAKLEEWRDAETSKEAAKKNPSEQKTQAIHDRVDCIVCFTDGCADVPQLIRKIESVFTDDKTAPGIKLSSVHKAKGLEASRVFVLNTEQAPLPAPWGRTAWEKGQEDNLTYVAITRAINELVYVS